VMDMATVRLAGTAWGRESINKKNTRESLIESTSLFERRNEIPLHSIPTIGGGLNSCHFLSYAMSEPNNISNLCGRYQFRIYRMSLSTIATVSSHLFHAADVEEGFKEDGLGSSSIGYRSHSATPGADRRCAREMWCFYSNET
jgi:hypothetical protein